MTHTAMSLLCGLYQPTKDTVLNSNLNPEDNFFDLNIRTYLLGSKFGYTLKECLVFPERRVMTCVVMSFVFNLNVGYLKSICW